MKGSAKAAVKSGAEVAPAPEVPVSEDDLRIRGLILAELDRRRVRPVARRTLALIAEGFVEPAEGLPGYRIVDMTGAVRRRDEGEGAAMPLTIHDLIDELTERHQTLMLPALPPQPPPEPARDPIADVRAAGLSLTTRGGVFFKGLANFQLDAALRASVISPEYLDGCYDLGLTFPDLCSSVYCVCAVG